MWLTCPSASELWRTLTWGEQGRDERLLIGTKCSFRFNIWRHVEGEGAWKWANILKCIQIFTTKTIFYPLYFTNSFYYDVRLAAVNFFLNKIKCKALVNISGCSCVPFSVHWPPGWIRCWCSGRWALSRWGGTSSLTALLCANGGISPAWPPAHNSTSSPHLEKQHITM